jgi:hypothetical protein
MVDWTTPKTWADEELVTANLLNTHLRDNLNALKAPPSDQVVRNNDAAYTTTSATLVEVDSTNLKCTITTGGGDVLVWFVGTFSASSGTNVVLDILIDATTRVAADYNGLVAESLGTTKAVITIPPVIISGLEEGEHSFTLMWRSTGETIRLHSDTNSGNALDNVPAILVAREVS